MTPNRSLQATLDPAAPSALAKAPSASMEAELGRWALGIIVEVGRL